MSREKRTIVRGNSERNQRMAGGAREESRTARVRPERNLPEEPQMPEVEIEDLDMTRSLPRIDIEDLDITQSLPKVEVEDLNVTKSLPKVEVEDLDVTKSLPKVETEDLDVTKSLPKVEVEDLDITKSLPKVEIEDLDVTRSLPTVDAVMRQEAEAASPSAENRREEGAREETRVMPDVRVEDLDQTRSMPRVEIEDLDQTRVMPSVSMGDVSMGDVSNYLDLSTEDLGEALHQASQETSAAEAILSGLGADRRQPPEEEPDGRDIRVTWEEPIQAPPRRRPPRRVLEQAEPEGEPEDEEQNADRKRRRILVAAAVAMVAVVVLALGGWGISRLVENRQMVSYYDSHFLPGTRINDQDCSNMTAEEVNALFSQEVEDYSLTIQGVNGMEDTIQASEIGLTMLFDVDFQTLIDQQDSSSWRDAEENPVSFTFTSGWEYDESLLEQRLAESPLFQNMTDSVDAEIAYDEATDQYVLHPETLGTRVDLERVFTLAKEAVGTLHTTLSLEEAGCYDAVRQADAAMEQAVETMNLYNKARISYTFGDETETLDPATVREAIVCDENSQVSLNTELLQAWVEGLAEAYDTVGTSRSFRSTSSGRVTVSGGNYGWKLDQEATLAQVTEAIQSGSTVTGDPVYSQSGKDRGSTDIGDTYIEVDLTNQMLYYYEDGDLELSTAIVSGRVIRNTKTVRGVYYVYSKETDRTLRGDDYESHVDYWMPFYGGYGLHDASWRSEFGGDLYLTEGSHGCVNMPVSKARSLYNMISVGTPVIVFGGEDSYEAPEETTPAETTPVETTTQAPEPSTPESTAPSTSESATQGTTAPESTNPTTAPTEDSGESETSASNEPSSEGESSGGVDPAPEDSLE